MAATASSSNATAKRGRQESETPALPFDFYGQSRGSPLHRKDIGIGLQDAVAADLAEQQMLLHFRGRIQVQRPHGVPFYSVLIKMGNFLDLHQILYRRKNQKNCSSILIVSRPAEKSLDYFSYYLYA
jgi:hypothetical protein